MLISDSKCAIRRLTLWPLYLLASSVSVGMPVDGQTEPGPFAACHASLDRRISAILLGHQDQTPVALSTPARDDMERNAPQHDDVQHVATPADLSVFAKQFWGGRGADLTAALTRLQSIRPTLESILQSEGLPGDLVGIVLIESAAQPFAQSPRRARGLWQLIPETARQYGLDVRDGHDQRIETDAATHAAARYLRDLYAKFENWPLALAAYNAGEGAVQRAIDSSKMPTFAQLSSAGRLPEETRAYVPAVLAAMNLLGPDRLLKPLAGHETAPIYARSTPTW